MGHGVLQQPVRDQRDDGQIQVFHVRGGQQCVAEGDQVVGLGLGQGLLIEEHGKQLGIQKGAVFGGKTADAGKILPQEVAVKPGVADALQRWRGQAADLFQALYVSGAV